MSEGARARPVREPDTVLDFGWLTSYEAEEVYGGGAVFARWGVSTLYSDQWATVHHADAASVADYVAPNSVHMCVTSPPYFGLRSYLAAEDVHKTHEIGAEESPEAYVAALVEVFRGVWRVLRDDGTCWLNLGDSFAGNRGYQVSNSKHKAHDYAGSGASRVPEGRKPKDLIGIPWLVAFALQQDGWYLRSDIVWSKPNPMPESVTDRPTKSHEYVFLLTKRLRYFYDAEAVKEGFSDKPSGWLKSGSGQTCYGTNGVSVPGGDSQPSSTLASRPASSGRNRRSVWRVATRPYSGAHFATFPPALIEPCIKAGTSEKGVCSECGAPWERVVERELYGQEPTGNERKAYHDGVNSQSAIQRNGQNRAGWSSSTTTDWQPTCSCNADTIPATVLDPFAGSGTTMHTARRLGRRSVGLELDSRCGKLIQERMGYQEVLL